MKNNLLLFIIFLTPSILLSQDITGIWQGYAVRSNPDCIFYPETFLVTYILEQNGNNVTGTTESILEDTPYFAIYNLTSGNLTNNNFLFFLDEPIQGIPPPGSAWCTSVVGELEFFEAEELLEGTLSSTNGSVCCEGALYLKKLELLSDTIQCKGESVELEVTGENVKWYSDENLDSLIGSGNTLEVVIDEPTSFFITQTFNVIGEETSAFRFDIDIYEPQITSFEIVTTNACNDNSGTIEVLLEDQIDALFKLDNDNFSNNNILEGLSAANYTLTIQDENGCEIDTSFQIINQDCELKIPNVFTPDGDGLNDYFGIVPLYDFQGKITLFKIFNRWGQKVIDLQNQNIEDAIWDGKQNNKPLPSDVYVYMIEIEYNSGKRELFSGDITLLR